ncbi:MAG: hypothetical protein KY461_06605 [Actinobacteria bacterium]|nr:hypothetical protein [Actinomycetota bacterium]
MLQREWVTLVSPDDDHLHYTFDVSFLLSDYTCIYGAGCQGVRADVVDEVVGCCLHGAYLNEDDDPDELARIVAEDLGPDTMQFHAEALADGPLTEDEEGEVHTRVHEGACIFQNRAGFEAGTGCALHHLADRRGEHHMTHKPVVCWQLPLHRTIEERTANDGAELEVHTIAAFERGHWGEGGSDFGWYCMDDDTAFVADRPVYRSMEHELREMVGDPVYEELAAYLDGRQARGGTLRFLPTV